MSLKKEDWKKVLDLPKNLGLKAGGGTGVTKALEEVSKKEGDFTTKKTVASGQAYDKALSDLKKLCEDLDKKHRKLFTTACDHLKKVAASAKKAMDDLVGEMNDLRQQETEARQRQAGRKALSDLFTDTIKTFRAVQTEKDLRDAFAEFKKKFEILAKPFPKLASVVATVKSFDKKDPAGLVGIRGAFIKLVQDANAAPM